MSERVLEGCDYLTPGKWYRFRRTSSTSGYIFNDEGLNSFLFLPDCAHLGDKPWTVINNWY